MADNAIVTAQVRGALLYTLTGEDILEYNVVCAAALAPGAKISGLGVDSSDALRELLGMPDRPEEVFSAETGTRTLGPAVTADLTLEGEQVTAVTLTAIRPRPKVGISWRGKILFRLYPEHAEMLERNGALALYLPQAKHEEDAQEILEQIDGILMTGGVDFHPRTYGQRQGPHGAEGWNLPRDTSDLAMIRQAIAMDVPMLGICRGTQGMTIALGGQLIQDVPLHLGQKVLDGKIDPSRVTQVLSGTLPGREPVPDPGYQRYSVKEKRFIPTYDPETNTYQKGFGCKKGHLRVVVDGLVHSKGPGYHTLCQGQDNESFVIDKNSKWLYPLLGRETMEFITSTHHQAVDPEHLGRGLSVAALASDGVVEAIEYKENLFALGVQWHPERDALKFFHGFPVDQQLCNAPIRGLVDHARLHRERKG